MIELCFHLTQSVPGESTLRVQFHGRCRDPEGLEELRPLKTPYLLGKRRCQDQVSNGIPFVVLDCLPAGFDRFLYFTAAEQEVASQPFLDGNVFLEQIRPAEPLLVVLDRVVDAGDPECGLVPLVVARPLVKRVEGPP